MAADSPSQSRPHVFAIFSIVAGIVGWFASFELLTEYLKVLGNPDYVPNCEVSVLVTCGPNMGSWQGSLFGFSNTIIGVSAFVAPIAVGVALLAGARFASWFWWIYQLGLLGGFVFVHWLFFQSVFSLHTLCPWCMVVWTAMIPLFWFSVLTIPAKGFAAQSKTWQRVSRGLLRWAWVIVLVDYLLIAFIAQMQLNWFAEFARA